MNRIKSAPIAKGLMWLTVFGLPTVCAAEGQQAASQPLPASAANVAGRQLASLAAPGPSIPASSPVAASSASIPMPVQLVNWPAHESTFLADIAKGLLGTFLGAALAFYLSSIQRKNQERKENVAAGNLALFGIRAISRNLSEMRLSLRDDVRSHRRLNANAPIWALARSWVFRPTEDLGFDYGSLTFLLDSQRGREAMLQLRYVEEIYRGAFHVYEVNQELSQKYKEIFAKVFDQSVTSEGVISWEIIEKALGTRLVAERTIYMGSMLFTTEIEIDHVKIAFDNLMAELRVRFGEEAWNLEFFPSPHHNRHASRLPAYPDDILEFLKERREVEARVRAREAELKAASSEGASHHDPAHK